MCMAEWKLGRKTTENILNQKCSNGILRRAKRRGVCGGGKMGMLTYYWPVNHDDNQST